MTVIDLTQVPSSVAMRLAGNTAANISPLNGSTQTLDRGGLRWEAVFNYTNVSKDKRAELLGILAGVRAQANRLRIPVYDNPKRGAYGGTPLVDGASQTGSTINVRGASNNITNWIRRGDYFGITVGTEVELKMCTASANSDGSGDIAGLAFEPRLRNSPADGAAIIVDDGVLGAPTGVFFLRNSVNGWSSRPFQSTSELSQVVFDMIEDLFITQ